jgi:hypothetical protein
VAETHGSYDGLDDCGWNPEEISIEEIRHYSKSKTKPYGIDFASIEKLGDFLKLITTGTMSDAEIESLVKLKMA